MAWINSKDDAAMCDCGRLPVETEYRKQQGMFFARKVCSYCRNADRWTKKSDTAHRYIATEQRKRYGYNFCSNPECADYGAKLTTVDVHHNDGTHGHNDRVNLIALCETCHAVETKLHSDNLKVGHSNRRVAYNAWINNGRKGKITF